MKKKALSKWVKQNLPRLVEAVTSAEANVTLTSGSARLDKAAELVAGWFDIPLVPEWLERDAVRLALTVIVELAQALYGRAHWYDELMKRFHLQPGHRPRVPGADDADAE